MLTLAIGDLFIPERAVDIPSKFKKLLSPNPDSIPTNNKISQVICLGNVVNSLETVKFLANLSPALHLVRGEFDDSNILAQQVTEVTKRETNLPLYNVIVLDKLRIGFTNGYQIVPKGDPAALSALARELDVDILVWGGTHKVEAFTLDGKFFINPGSATGAPSFEARHEEEEEGEEEEEEEEKEEKEKKEKEEEEQEKEEDEEEEEEEKKEGDGSGEKKESEGEESAEKEEQEQENDDNKETEMPRNEQNELGSSTEIDLEILNRVQEQFNVTPSFCLLDTQGSSCTLYIYTFLNGDVKVDKVTYQKE